MYVYKYQMYIINDLKNTTEHTIKIIIEKLARQKTVNSNNSKNKKTKIKKNYKAWKRSTIY